MQFDNIIYRYDKITKKSVISCLIKAIGLSSFFVSFIR